MLLLLAVLALALASDHCLPSRNYGYHEGACVYREADSYGEPQMHGAPTRCCEEAQDRFQRDEPEEYTATTQTLEPSSMDGIAGGYGIGEALTPADIVGEALTPAGIVGEALTPSPRVLASVNDYESSNNVVPSQAGEYNIELPGAGEQDSECPGPFRWNQAASRCQRLIASGNTQFIKTSCCKDLIPQAEEQCPGPFRWNAAASRCQRLIASGNTRFIKTSCCKDMIEEAEERSGYEAAVQQDAEINSYEDVREEEKQISDGGCIRKCYFKKNAKADAEQIDCDELGRYHGTRECKRNGNVVPCDQLTCVNEVAIEDDAPPPSIERTCRRVCYYRAYPGARTKKRIPCSEVDTKYVGDKACTRNGKTVACDLLQCPE